MTPKTILAASLAAIFAVSMIMTPAMAASSGFLIIKSRNASIDEGFLDVSLRTKSAIPTNGKAGAFGYAVLTNSAETGLNNVVVLVTHLPIDDSSHENQKTGFHTHVLDLMSPTAACSEHALEVDLNGSVANSAFDSDYEYKIKGNKASIVGIPTSDLDGATDVIGVVAFTVTPVFDGDTLTNLCVDVV